MWWQTFSIRRTLRSDALGNKNIHTHKLIYKQTLLSKDKDSHTHRHFYTKTFSHTDAFYTQALLHTTLWHTKLDTQTCLHTESFYSQKATPHRSKPQSHLIFWRSNLISCEKVATDTSKSPFHYSFWRSNLISCEKVAFRGASLALPRALREK